MGVTVGVTVTMVMTTSIACVIVSTAMTTAVTVLVILRQIRLTNTVRLRLDSETAAVPLVSFPARLSMKLQR